MTTTLYLLQVTLIAVVTLTITWRMNWFHKVQICLWALAVSVLVLRFGVTGQLDFYSNDQRYYRATVVSFTSNPLLDIDWLTSGSRFPFTAPAVFLYHTGIEPTLALKSVALICLLALTRNVLAFDFSNTMKARLRILLFTACGPIGIFFSALALRETMMMLCTTRFIFSKSPPERVLVLFLLFALRPHLAVSLLAASIAVTTWSWFLRGRSRIPYATLLWVISATMFGHWIYTVGTEVLEGASDVTGHNWGIEPVVRIASNFFGLQFLTAESDTVVLSLAALIGFRLILIETILIPTLFTVAMFVQRQSRQPAALVTLVAFSIYVALVTNTDFNSFRQNIPFMPAMGLVIMSTSRNASLGSANSSSQPESRDVAEQTS